MSLFRSSGTGGAELGSCLSLELPVADFLSMWFLPLPKFIYSLYFTVYACLFLDTKRIGSCCIIHSLANLRGMGACSD